MAFDDSVEGVWDYNTLHGKCAKRVAERGGAPLKGNLGGRATDLSLISLFDSLSLAQSFQRKDESSDYVDEVFANYNYNGDDCLDPDEFEQYLLAEYTSLPEGTKEELGALADSD